MPGDLDAAYYAKKIAEALDGILTTCDDFDMGVYLKRILNALSGLNIPPIPGPGDLSPSVYLKKIYDILSGVSSKGGGSLEFTVYLKKILTLFTNTTIVNIDIGDMDAAIYLQKILAVLQGGVSPVSIPGLKLWLDASDSSTLFQNSTFTIAASADGNPVGGWKDKSGQLNHVIQATAGNRPALKLGIQNGRAVVRFTAANSHYLATVLANTIPKIAPITIFAVVRTATNAPVGNPRIIAAESGGNKGVALGQYAAKGNIRATKAGVGNFNGVMPGFSTDKFEIVEMAFDSKFGATFYINGGLRDYLASAVNSNAGAVRYLVGASIAGNEYWNGDIAEILVYDVEVSTARRIVIETYLAGKYNIKKAPMVNVSQYQDVPCYSGTNYVHPDVIYFPNGWNGWKYWMAFTPYPGTAIENPSIVVSNDGNSWQVPTGLTNPIVPNPGGGANNCDSSLCMSADGLTMYLLWMEYKAATYNKVYMKSSTDGITWGVTTLLLNVAVNTAMSPSVLWDGSQFVMYVGNSTGAYTIDRRTCATIDGVWSAASAVLWTNPHSLSNKHVDVLLDNGKYYLIFMDVDNLANAGLYFATGTDGITFTLDPNFRVPAQIGIWDYLPYRACLSPTGFGELDIWYSGFDSSGLIAKIARTRYDPR